jgi:Domain of unknown function (DUF4430)
MKSRSILALGGASLALAVAPGVAQAAQKVSVRIEGASKTLQAARTVTTPSGSITKFGAPAGACPGSSVQGALQVATHGNWKGTYSKTYSEYFVTSILGETPNSKTGYWGIWVDNKYATTGACQIKLHAGDDVLFAVDSAKKHEHPLGITAPATATAGKPFTLKAVSYSDQGKATAQAGVSFNGINGATNKQGKLTVTVLSSKKAPVTFTGSEKGYIRASATVKIG